MSETHFDWQDSQLVSDLLRISHKSPKLIRSSVYSAPSDPTVEIRSWKMNEFKYYDVPSPFPTLARGLFTKELSSEKGGQPRYQIVARGYDKFFNIGEVPWTDWSCLEAHTGPKYTLSVKSNGCIIFIAAISPSKLVVASKHSIGHLEGIQESHSQAGHRWLKTHLASRGKTEEQLAAVLWENNWTTVTELCDDEFEEHVLPYPPEKSGLYLHGINESCKEFQTLSARVVHAFAEEWGFLTTLTLEYDTLVQVKSFTDHVAKTGEWRGEPVEGFVVRTSITDPKRGATTRDKRPPYPTGSSFFFKVKFDEPYMMYRDWREITKSLLSTKGSLNDVRLHKSKMKRKETQLYVKWVKNQIQTNRSAFKDYTKGKGIIATREQFLNLLRTEQGKTDLSALEEPASPPVKEFGKTVIVPVAIPGCGKTSVAVALAHLFGFGHTQSDDVRAKKPAAAFIKNVVNHLREDNVVIADKNNHLLQHRAEIRKAVSRFDPPVRLLALNWALDKPAGMLVRVCGNRVFGRGDRHQTLRADKTGNSHEGIIRGFISQTEKLSDSEVDATIEMDVCESLEAAVARAVDGCVSILGLERPTREEINEAVQVAKEYAPKTKEKTADKQEKKAKESTLPRYFAILPKLDIEAIVASQMRQAEGVPYDGKTFWKRLADDNQLTEQPHVTIVHMADIVTKADLWERCTTLDQLPTPSLFSFTLKHLVWNDRVMALTVDDLVLAQGQDNDADLGQEKHEFISLLSAEVREGLHITVGTLNAGVPAYEAKGLVEMWRRGERKGVGSLELVGLSGSGRIRGLH